MHNSDTAVFDKKKDHTLSLDKKRWGMFPGLKMYGIDVWTNLYADERMTQCRKWGIDFIQCLPVVRHSHINWPVTNCRSDYPRTHHITWLKVKVTMAILLNLGLFRYNFHWSAWKNSEARQCHVLSKLSLQKGDHSGKCSVVMKRK